jgi:hypothetical protein
LMAEGRIPWLWICSHQGGCGRCEWRACREQSQGGDDCGERRRGVCGGCEWGAPQN